MADVTRVDVTALADFQTTLAARLAEVESVLTRLEYIRDNPPKFGNFADAVEKAVWYAKLHLGHINRVDRLRNAIIAVQEATATIAAQYDTTEELNLSSAQQIAGLLTPVDTTLGQTGVGQAAKA